MAESADFYRHPNPIYEADAVAIANRSGYRPQSVKWLDAYRHAYIDISHACNLNNYLAALDREICRRKSTILED